MQTPGGGAEGPHPVWSMGKNKVRGQRPRVPHHIINQIFITVSHCVNPWGGPKAPTLCEAWAKIRQGAKGPEHNIILLTKYLLLSPIVWTLGGGAEGPHPVRSTGKPKACLLRMWLGLGIKYKNGDFLTKILTNNYHICMYGVTWSRDIAPHTTLFFLSFLPLSCWSCSWDHPCYSSSWLLERSLTPPLLFYLLYPSFLPSFPASWLSLV